MAQIDAKLLRRFFIDETPSGSGTSFTLSQTPMENDAVEVYIDGLKLRAPTHYSISGTALTLVDPLAAGQSIRVNYIQRSGGS